MDITSCLEKEAKIRDRSEEYRDRSEMRRLLRGPKVCEVCAAEIPEMRHRCDQCLADTKKLSKKRKRTRHRARLHAAAREPYSLWEIATRDRHICGLCGDKVNMALVVPDLKAPTIDHIIPLAKGGDDTKINVQLAHFACNSRKGHRS